MKKSYLAAIAAAAGAYGVAVAQEQGTPAAGAERSPAAGIESGPAAGVERGKQVYEYWCGPCHGPGLGLPGFGALPGTHQLAIKYRGTDIPAVLDERTDLVPEFIEVTVRQGVSFMPHFRKTEVSDEELEALSAYLTRNNPGGR